MTPPALRVFAWGVGVATLYLVVAAAEFRSAAIPIRTLFDGVAPLPPYRWVRPPDELAKDNQPPEAGMGTVPLEASGSAPVSVATSDGQATVIIGQRAIPREVGETAATVWLTPLDPTSAAPPPAGFRFDGNAYRIEIFYASSGKPVEPSRHLSVALRYATGGTMMVRWSGSGWTVLPATRFAGNLHLLVTNTETTGVIAVVAPQTLPYRPKTPWWVYVLALGIPVVVALVIGFLPRILAYLRSRG